MLKRSDLLAYQAHAIEWGKPRRNNAKWIDMGLGKTVIEATTFADLQDACAVSKMLVVAPKRVARKVWSDEVQTWEHLSHLRVSRIVGDVDQCFRALQDPRADIYTVGRDRVAWLHAQFVQNGRQVVEWPFDYVALDEAQSFASQSSVRFKCMYELRKLTRFKRLSELSGTPMPNGYMKLWSQLKLLDNGRRLGLSERDMQERWFSPPTGMFAKWQVLPTAKAEIHDLLRDIVLVLREEDYLDLPPVRNNFIRCQLSAAAMATYRRFEREFIAEVAGKRLNAVNAGVLDGKLLQLANGACYTGIDREWVPFHDAKLEALDETLDGIAGKALVCYAFNHDKARIIQVLERASRASDRVWKLLDSDRDFERWANGEIDWGVLHPASAGHGLNDVYKAGAKDMVFFGLTNNHEWHKQVRARLEGGHRRIEGITFHYIVTDGTRDDDYVALLKRKEYDEDDLMASLATRIYR